MRPLAVEMHMRSDRLNRYKAMGALFVKAALKKSSSLKRPQVLMNLGADLISMIVPGGNMVDLKSVFKFIRYFAAERLWVYKNN